ncbi:MAG: tetratricopeptide repeat protein [Bacteroidota bacterium]
MEKITVISFLLFLSLTACQSGKTGSNQDQLKAEIQNLEAQLLQGGGDVAKNQEAALQLVEKTFAYAETFPSDTLTPTLLFKAGEVARGAQEYGKAVQLWGEVWRTYPNHRHAPMALFLQGFTFDTDLRDVDMAKKYYNQFLHSFPQDSLAGQVKQLLAVVEKSPEELVKEFEKKSN